MTDADKQPTDPQHLAWDFVAQFDEEKRWKHGVGLEEGFFAGYLRGLADGRKEAFELNEKSNREIARAITTMKSTDDMHMTVTAFNFLRDEIEKLKAANIEMGNALRGGGGPYSALVQRDQLREELAEAKAEIERIKKAPEKILEYQRDRYMHDAFALREENKLLRKEFAEAEAALEDMNKNCISLSLHESRLTQEKQRGDELVSALEFYAHMSNFTHCSRDGEPEVADDEYPNWMSGEGEYDVEDGAVARAAIKKYKGEG